MTTVADRLAKLGITVPAVAAPAANYVPWVQTGKLVFTAGQLPFVDGKLLRTGLLGRDLDTEAGREAAGYCARNVIGVLGAACDGDLERIARIVKITVFVASTPDFQEQHLVGNGASDALVGAFGDKGKHARSALGMAVLPLNAPVEVEAIAELV
ncbi:MAG: RidA family protein [Rhizobiaceae bacterium]|nr:RidA family protein [Rhizobiaceae bacterium]